MIKVIHFPIMSKMPYCSLIISYLPFHHGVVRILLPRTTVKRIIGTSPVWFFVASRIFAVGTSAVPMNNIH